jgi:pimeloyl-ACP methyl ester carboxylesterase
MDSIIIFFQYWFIRICSNYDAYGFIIFLCPCSIRICHWVHRGQDEQGYSSPDEGESAATFVDVATLPPGLLVFDSGGFAYLNPEMFDEAFVQDANATEAETLAVVQKPAHQSLFTEPSGPPAWKQLPIWFEVSESDHIIRPDVQRQFAKRMNATTISLNSSHASLVSHPGEIAELILNATKGSTK